jgi:hypothetical protein
MHSLAAAQNGFTARWFMVVPAKLAGERTPGGCARNAPA